MAVVMEATEADTATAAMVDMVATGNFFNIYVKVFHFHTHKLKLNVLVVQFNANGGQKISS